MKKVRMTDQYGDSMVSIGHIGNVPLDFEDCGLDDVEEVLNITLNNSQKVIINNYKNLININSNDSNKWCALTLGSVGNGKTMLGCAAVNSWNSTHLKNYELKARYTTQSELDMKAEGFHKEETIKEFCKYGLLFLDEIDSEEWNPLIKFLVQEIVQHYYNNKKLCRLIISGNISPVEIDKMLSDRTRDRIKNAYCTVVKEKSYR